MRVVCDLMWLQEWTPKNAYAQKQIRPCAQNMTKINRRTRTTI